VSKSRSLHLKLIWRACSCCWGFGRERYVFGWKWRGVCRNRRSL